MNITYIVFTNEKINELPAPVPESGSKSAIYRDSGRSSLTVEVDSRGRKKFVAYFDLGNGNYVDRRIVLGKFPKMKVGQARRLALEIDSAIGGAIKFALIDDDHQE